ncbi:MAG: SPOR domain-containing protein [Gammaproteobacteria bacterium]|nr:SPOR domain-containing protein [Gammaproteobacteria bacterium]MDH3431820.1 SPOR domain-containing protein [Gammaproteobacteria bacterium]MDH3433810.1 SPOR domain-containing protein [Gammaproteobacteria bacterium]
MKNLLLLLLLANILYFVWGMLAEESSEPGIVVVDESMLGPPLNVSANRDAEAVASVGAVLGSGEPSALEAVVGRSCVTVGPFKASADADIALTQYAGEGMRTSLRSTRGTIFVGHWVMIRDIADRATGNRILDKLREGGLSDAYLVPTEEGGLNISLGLFGDLDGAEKVELQAKSLDLPADITPRTREGSVFFVDIGLPPGKGAGAIVDQYGEEKVLLRDAATCPQSN